MFVPSLPLHKPVLGVKWISGWDQNQSLIYHLTVASRSVSDLYKTWVICMEIDIASDMADMPLWFSIEWTVSFSFTGVNPFLIVSMSNHYHWGELTPDNDPINRPTRPPPSYHRLIKSLPASSFSSSMQKIDLVTCFKRQIHKQKKTRRVQVCKRYTNRTGNRGKATSGYPADLSPYTVSMMHQRLCAFVPL